MQLQKNKANATLDSTENKTPTSIQHNLDNFSKNVLSTLMEKNIPPLPINFQAYFEQMLDSENLDFQKKIYNLMEDDTKNSDKSIDIQKDIHMAFMLTKDILKSTSLIYKNLALINEIEHKWFATLKTENAENDKFIYKIQSLQQAIDNQIEQLKDSYQQCDKILEHINNNTIYDLEFDVYNKRYFIQCVQDEQKMVQKFHHCSTILMLALPKHIIQYLNNDKTLLFIMKTVAKLLLKTSRRSDITGYIGNGIFSMLLKYSDIISAQKASERIMELLKNTSIFIGDNEINLDLHIGISKITSYRNIQDTLNFAIIALRQAQQKQTSYMIYKEDND